VVRMGTPGARVASKGPRRAFGFKANCRGASAVEFAIIAPFFIFMLLGMIAYGIYLGAAHGVQQLAADAARMAVAGLNTSERVTLVKSYVARNAVNYAFIDPLRLQLEVRDSPTDPNLVVVRLRYDSSELPIWNLLTNLPLPNKIITRSSTIRVGGI
jgi:Flp pilus assembly protein TadG